jgi:hypothetical protein
MARIGSMLAVAAVGLAAQNGFDRDAYARGMWLCAGLATAGAAIAAVGIRNVRGDEAAGG